MMASKSLVGLIALLLSVLPLTGQVKYEDILRGPGANWLTYSGDYKGWRYSPLNQITQENVAKLVPKWTYNMGHPLETSPLVFDGVMYVTASNEVDALDARTGRRIWRCHDDQSSQESPIAAWRCSATGSFFRHQRCCISWRCTARPEPSYGAGSMPRRRTAMLPR